MKLHELMDHIPLIGAMATHYANNKSWFAPLLSQIIAGSIAGVLAAYMTISVNDAKQDERIFNNAITEQKDYTQLSKNIELERTERYATDQYLGQRLDSNTKEINKNSVDINGLKAAIEVRRNR